MKNWSEESVFQLIESCKNHSFMGPQGGKDKNYYKNNLKEDAWKDITTLAGQAEDLALEYNGELFCGSSAIGDYWVLTAGHCIFFSNPENIKVRAGSLQQGKNGTLHEVAEFVSHPKFDLNLDMDNDIGLIKLKDPLSSNPYVRYVGLPDQGEPTPIGSRLVVAGWGCTKPPKLADQYRVLSSFFRHQSHSSPHYYTSYGSSSRPAPEDQWNGEPNADPRKVMQHSSEPATKLRAFPRSTQCRYFYEPSKEGRDGCKYMQRPILVDTYYSLWVWTILTEKQRTEHLHNLSRSSAYGSLFVPQFRSLVCTWFNVII
ncbi:unnamed protein product [Timema podura]|uniref:Peptidase S1 domain-containing protein n=1 Tax=Timema podura TaxID=61482 RepID=A0ABN7NQ08_TIMPD|nr:unnamed protein product [Timema podura]